MFTATAQILITAAVTMYNLTNRDMHNLFHISDRRIADIRICISHKACYSPLLYALFILMVPVHLSSLADGASRALLWKCVFPHLVAGGALWQVQRHLKQTRIEQLLVTATIKNVHFARFYKDSSTAGCSARIVVLPSVLHGFENARNKSYTLPPK